MLDFGMLPPEINSARMYAGPGSGPMMAAAAVWDELAAELHSAAASYGSVISGLTSDGWRGLASASMAAAAAPYVAWMSTTAARAEQTATRARAAAAAYEATFAATVPPPVIAANRALLMSLIAANALGQNTPAIAATEAQYAEMWAQDAAAMYGYAGSSAAASRVTPFTSPTQTTGPAGLAGQAAAVARATGTSASSGVAQTTSPQLTAAVPRALQSLASPAAAASSASGLGSILGPNSNFWNTMTSSGALNPAQVVQAVTGSAFLGAAASGVASDGPSRLGPAPMAAGLGPGARTVPGLSGAGGVDSAVSAGPGRAGSVGVLSVPPNWTSGAPPVSPLATALGGTPLTAPETGMPGMPGVPLGNPAGSGAAITPRYGFRPTVMARPPAAG